MNDLSPEQIHKIYERVNRRWPFPDLPDLSDKNNANPPAGRLFSSLGTPEIIILIILVLLIIGLVVYTVVRNRRLRNVDGAEQTTAGFFGRRKYSMDLKSAFEDIQAGRLGDAAVLMFGEFLNFMEREQEIGNIRVLTKREIRLRLKGNAGYREIFQPLSREHEEIIYGHRPGSARRLLETLERMKAL